MKKIFAFMKTALVAAVGLSLFACSVDGSKDDAVAKDCGSVKFSIAIPKFMVPDTDTNARMVMPSTSVIKLSIYDSAANWNDEDHLVYKKEFSVGNSGLSYSELSENYNFITAELNDVPIGNYEAESMFIQLYDSKINSDPTMTPLTYGYNANAVVVTSETGTESATATFYTLPAECNDISTEFEAEWNEENGQYNTTTGVYEDEFMLDDDTVSGYDIYYQAYKVTIPAFYGLDVSLTAKNESQKEVAVVVYTENGVASDLDITVLKNASFNNKKFASIGDAENLDDEDKAYYIVLYTKGALTGISEDSLAKLTFTLTEFPD